MFPSGRNGPITLIWAARTGPTGYLAQLTPVRLAWTSKIYGDKFKGRQPESLSLQEWQEIESFLTMGKQEP